MYNYGEKNNQEFDYHLDKKSDKKELNIVENSGAKIMNKHDDNEEIAEEIEIENENKNNKNGKK